MNLNSVTKIFIPILIAIQSASASATVCEDPASSGQTRDAIARLASRLFNSAYPGQHHTREDGEIISVLSKARAFPHGARVLKHSVKALYFHGSPNDQPSLHIDYVIPPGEAKYSLEYRFAIHDTKKGLAELKTVSVGHCYPTPAKAHRPKDLSIYGPSKTGCHVTYDQDAGNSATQLAFVNGLLAECDAGTPIVECQKSEELKKCQALLQSVEVDAPADGKGMAPKAR